MRKKFEIEERPICNAVVVFRERGNYLQRLEQFEKAIQAYNEALRWNDSDVRSLLGRCLARAKSTHYAGALADAAQAAELEPQNLTALQMRAQTEYEKCEFERALVLAHRGRRLRRFPPDFAECSRCAEETVRECSGKTANKTLSAVKKQQNTGIKGKFVDEHDLNAGKQYTVNQHEAPRQIKEMSLVEKQKSEQISRRMASKYLARMAHDKYFLTTLCKDERLSSANKKGAQKLQELAHKALRDLENRQAVLRERQPFYAACASEATARERITLRWKQRITRTQQQHENDAKRLIQTAQALYEQRETNKCIEQAEFGMEQISRKPSHLLPVKEKYLQALQDIVANAFLDQKRVRRTMSESDREKRAFILLGMSVSREPSRDSVLRVRPPAPPRDSKRRLRNLERMLSMSTREPERCYLLHELARLHIDTKQGLKARFYASKCQAEARASNQSTWLLNAAFLLARCHLLQNNRPEARAVLLEAVGLAHLYSFDDVAEFYDTRQCVQIVLMILHVCPGSTLKLFVALESASNMVGATSSHILLEVREIKGGKRVDVSLDGKRSASPMDSRNTKGIVDALPVFKCANVSLEGEVGITEAPIERREKDMVRLMQDEDLRSEAKHLFKRMSILPAARRFSIMPGAQVEDTVPLNAATRRISIIPKSQQPIRIVRRSNLPLGFQDFDA